jgi:hypothetical protein
VKKSELRAMLREMLREELITGNYLTEGVSLTEAPDKSLLATHVAQHPDFEAACMSGNATQIMTIVDSVMQERNLLTPGAKKLRNDIFRMTRGDAKIPAKIGENILFFVWNSRMSGTGYAVI